MPAVLGALIVALLLGLIDGLFFHRSRLPVLGPTFGTGRTPKTNKDREQVEGPGVRRRNLILVLSLQGAAALARSNTAKVCTEEEFAERNERVLEQKRTVRNR